MFSPEKKHRAFRAAFGSSGPVVGFQFPFQVGLHRRKLGVDPGRDFSFDRSKLVMYNVKTCYEYANLSIGHLSCEPFRYGFTICTDCTRLFTGSLYCGFRRDFARACRRAKTWKREAPREQKKPGLSTGPRLPALSARIRNKSHLTALSAAFAALSASLARCAAALASAALTAALS